MSTEMIIGIAGGVVIAAVSAWLYKNAWPYFKPEKPGPGSKIKVGPYGQIEGEPSDDPYDPPSMRGGG